MRVAIMQPYLFPYAGYFRLFAATDCFVIYDCVQFPRRGRVHRCELPSAGTDPNWLTLPIVRCPRRTRINAVELPEDASSLFNQRLARQPSLWNRTGPIAEDVWHALTALSPGRKLADYLEYTLRSTIAWLGLDCEVVRSSTLTIEPSLGGQARIVAIARSLQASEYINSPGGRALYDSQELLRHGLRLRFLQP